MTRGIFRIQWLLSVALYSLLTVSAMAGAPVHYVSLSGSNVSPFSSWATAATNIQAAIDVALANENVLVTNGTYQTGGRVVPGYTLTNRVVIDKVIQVTSVNGPLVTIIKGAHDPITLSNGDAAVRCAYVTNGAFMGGFTFTNGATRGAGADLFREQSGGGVFCEIGARLSSCVFAGNSAAYAGGGSFQGQQTRCRYTGNFAGQNGGATWGGDLNNSVVVGNSRIAAYAASLSNCTVVANLGGTGFCSLYNCIVYSNEVPGVWSNNFQGIITYTCTTPLPPGAGNITNEPKFENFAAGNLHLLATSPCRNAGNNTFVSSAIDFDGLTRIVNAIVDMGAYEFSDADGDGLPGWWELQYGLVPSISNTAAANNDSDDSTDIEEYIADTNPTNPASFFPRIALTNVSLPTLSIVISNTSAGRNYGIYGATNLIAQSWLLLSSEMPGTPTNVVFTTTLTNEFGALRTGVRIPF